MTVKLKYIGPDPEEIVRAGGALPLPEGWGALDHEEPDEEIAAAKVASGNYENEKPARKAADKE